MLVQDESHIVPLRKQNSRLPSIVQHLLNSSDIGWNCLGQGIQYRATDLRPDCALILLHLLYIVRVRSRTEGALQQLSKTRGA